MKNLWLSLAFLLLIPVAAAQAPVCLYQDVLSGPASGGEGGNGIYLSIYGANFGSSRGTSTVTVNGTAVAQYIYWGADATGNRQQIGVQIASATTGTGNVVVTTSAGSTTCPSTFTVRSGNIYYIGSGIDTDAPGSNCTNIKNGTAGGGAGGSGTYASPWTLTNAVNIDTYSAVNLTFGGTSGYTTANPVSTSGGHGTGLTVFVTASGGVVTIASADSAGSGYLVGDVLTITQAGSSNDATVTVTGYNEGLYGSSTQRTPRTYYECMSAGDTLVFLNGAQFLYGDGSNLHTSFAMNKGVGSSSSFFTFMARPGATVQLGSEDVSVGIRDYSDTYTVLSGLTVTGSHGSGSAIEFGATQAYVRIVNNSVSCPDCAGESAAITGGAESDVTVGLEILGNYVTNVGCSDPGGVTNKQYHDLYFDGNGIEVGWNKVANSCAQNGIQINYYEDNAIGYGNLSIHDNDIESAIGAGINMASIDPNQGPVNVYNNIIHHVGTKQASDGNGNTIYAGISFPGYAPSAVGGTAYVYNNTIFDSASYLNSYAARSACALFLGTNSGQTNFTVNFSNNIISQPAYTNTSTVNPIICGDNVATMLTGTNNIIYSASSCVSGCTTYSELTSTTVDNPLFTSTTTPGPWTNLELQSTSTAIGAGSASLYPTLDFNGVTRPYSPAIGALEYESGGGSSSNAGMSGRGGITGGGRLQ